MEDSWDNAVGCGIRRVGREGFTEAILYTVTPARARAGLHGLLVPVKTPNEQFENGGGLDIA